MSPFFETVASSLPTAPPVLAFMPMGYEWIIILAIALLIFGKRLPGAARGIGQGILEFKRGIKGEPETSVPLDDRQVTRFDSQTGKPLS